MVPQTWLDFGDMTLTLDLESHLIKLEFCCLKLMAAHRVCTLLGHCLIRPPNIVVGRLTGRFYRNSTFQDVIAVKLRI